MYRVTKDGKILTVVSELQHCRMQSNGVPVRTDDENAPGIIVDGKIYNLPGYETATVEKMEDDRPVIGDIVADSDAANDIYMALAELGNIVAGGVNNG